MSDVSRPPRNSELPRKKSVRLLEESSEQDEETYGNFRESFTLEWEMQKLE